MARDLSRHHQARREKTTACARIPLRTRNGPSCHRDPPAGVHSKYWKSHTTTIFLFFSFLKWGFYTKIRIDLSCWFHCFTRWRACRECLRLLLCLGPQDQMLPREGGGGHLGILVGVCRSVLQILTLFQTKKCHSPHPYASSDQTFKLHTCCKTWSLGRFMSSEIRA